jgi:hypothetical protein
MSPLISITLEGFRDALGRFDRWTRELERSQGDLARYVGREASAVLRQNAPYSRTPSTDHLADTISARVYHASPGTFEVRISVPPRKAQVLRWIREGTPPHIIRPVRARWLRFFWQTGPRGAGIYYFKQVNHPGTAPNDFVARSRPAIQDLAFSEFRQRVGRIFLR